MKISYFFPIVHGVLFSLAAVSPGFSETLEEACNHYKEGIGTNTEVLDAESLRTVNYVSYDKASNDAVLAVLRLRYAAGSL